MPLMRTSPFRRLAVAAVLLAACAKEKAATVPITTAAVERRDIVIDAEATGVVEPINVIEVKSKASGQISAMPVETGSNVKAGDLLVAVETRDVQNQYNQVAAEVQAARASLAVAEAQRKRSDELFKARVVTAQENEAAQLQYANAQSQLVRARTNLDLAQQRLEDATVRAPVAGTVIEKTVSLGQVITSATGAFGGGTTLLKMADLAQVRVRALVNESDIGSIRAGLTARVVVDAYPNQPFAGTVEKIEPQAVIQQSVTMFPVLVSLDNREGLLKPGMNGEVSVLIDRRADVLSIPNDAIRNPREAGAVATMLGLNPDTVQAQLRAQQSQMRGGGNRAEGGAAGAAPGAVNVSRGEVELADASQQQPPAGARQRGDSGRRRMMGGDRSGRRRMMGGDSAGRRRTWGGDSSGRGRRTMGGDSAGRGGRQGMRQGGAAPQMQGEFPAGGATRSRSGLVFVKVGEKFEPRVVRLGAANYDHTEVVSGLKEGEQVALLAAAAMQAQRQAATDRMRGNMGGGGLTRQQPAGGAPGAGGGGPPGGGGGRPGGGGPPRP
jgi:HlyD family secretion protein